MPYPWKYAIHPPGLPAKLFRPDETLAKSAKAHEVVLQLPYDDEWEIISTCIHDAVKAERYENRHPETILLGGVWYAAWRKRVGYSRYEDIPMYPWRDHDEGVFVICNPNEEFNLFLRGKQK